MTMQSRQIVMMALVLTGPVISGASAGIVFDGSGDPADVGLFPIDPGGIINTPRAGAIAGDGLTFYQNDAVGSVARRDICVVNIWACPEDARSPDIEGELDNGAGYFVEFRFEAVDNGVSAFGWGGFAGCEIHQASSGVLSRTPMTAPSRIASVSSVGSPGRKQTYRSIPVNSTQCV